MSGWIQAAMQQNTNPQLRLHTYFYLVTIKYQQMQIAKQELSTAHCNQRFVMSNVNMNVLLSHNELYIFSLFWPQKVYAKPWIRKVSYTCYKSDCN